MMRLLIEQFKHDPYLSSEKDPETTNDALTSVAKGVMTMHRQYNQ